MKKLIAVRRSHNGSNPKKIFFVLPPESGDTDSTIETVKKIICENNGKMSDCDLAEKMKDEGYIVFTDQECESIIVYTETLNYAKEVTFYN